MELRTSLQGYELQLERITTEIRLQPHPNPQLQDAQSQLQHFLGLQNRLFSPVRKLPTEVLQLVFDQLVEQNVVSNRSPVSCKVPALQLSHVCLQWRIMARSHAPSWSSICLAVLALEDDPVHLTSLGREELLDMVLKLSHNHPLTIRINDSELHEFSPSDDDELSSSDINLLEMIFSERHRWQSLQLSPALVHRIWTYLFGSFPNLKAVSLDRGEPEESCEWITRLPSLRRLSLQTPLAISDISIDSLPLTQLSIDAATLSEVLNLASIPMLARFTLGTLLGDEWDVPVLEDKTFKNLRTLRIDIIHEIDRILRRLFQHTTIPQLSILDISGCLYGMEDWPQTEFCDLLVRSSCRLTVLKLAELPITEDHLITLLPHLSHLKRLSVNEMTYPWATISPLGLAFISKLATKKDEWVSGSPFVHLPSLQDLHLGGSFRWHGNEHRLADLVHMLESRATICTSDGKPASYEVRLRKIRLHCWNAVLEPSLVQRMAVLKEKGIKVHLLMDVPGSTRVI